jgi:hypothetical protein
MIGSKRSALGVAASLLCAGFLGAAPAGAQSDASAPPARSRGATMRGLVSDTADIPLANATVELTNRNKRGKTDEAGRFVLTGLARGAYAVNVKRVGFRPQYFYVEVQADGEAEVHVRLAPVVTELATVVVNGERRMVHPKLKGFYARKDGDLWAGAGSLFDRKDIDRWNPATVSDLVRQANGVTVGRGPNGQMSVFSRRGCPITIFVDGQAAQPGLSLDQLPIHWVEAIEVYPSMVSAPAELRANTASMCGGSLAIWTRNQS